MPWFDKLTMSGKWKDPVYPEVHAKLRVLCVSAVGDALAREWNYKTLLLICNMRLSLGGRAILPNIQSASLQAQHDCKVRQNCTLPLIRSLSKDASLPGNGSTSSP